MKQCMFFGQAGRGVREGKENVVRIGEQKRRGLPEKEADPALFLGAGRRGGGDREKEGETAVCSGRTGEKKTSTSP